MHATVSAIHIYPIKSCRGLTLKATRFDAMGPVYDRRLMLVDGDGRFLSQRELPRMALIDARIAPMAIQVSAPDMPPLKVPTDRKNAPRVEVGLWGGRGDAEDLGEHAADWFSSFLQTRCRLVRFPDDGFRPVDPDYARFEARVAFADGFPVLLTSESSLKELNARMDGGGGRVPMDRFRPNLVVRGSEPFEEDRWRQIRVGELVLDVVKPCARCKITTVDQITGKTGTEPLATLAGFRKRDNEVLFGQNCVHHGPGSVRVGDEVEILEWAEPPA